MNKLERDKVCKTCTHHKNDSRYGVICGLTDNIANFTESCRTYSKNKTAIITKPTRSYSSKTPQKTKKKSKGFGNIFRIGIVGWIIIKIILAVIKNVDR